MGVYLNGSSAYGLFQEAYSLSYYVDKSEIISELVPLIELKKNIMERSGKRDEVRGCYEAAQIREDNHGEYDRFLFWKRRGQP